MFGFESIKEQIAMFFVTYLHTWGPWISRWSTETQGALLKSIDSRMLL